MPKASERQLEAAARAAFPDPKQRTVVFDFEGRRYVAKRLAERPRKLVQTLFMHWLVKRITGQPLPMKTLALSEAAKSVDFEVNRLQTLAASGVRIPRVALKSADFFVLDHCGTVVATLLETWPRETWRHELLQLAEELGEFHRAGHWHGGAQIKNITQRHGENYRIDFEENFGNFLPLAITQLNDLLIFLNSISLAGPIDQAEARDLLPQLLNRYFAAHPSDEIKELIGRLLPLMRTLARLVRPFQHGSKKGIRRILILVDVLREFEETCKPKIGHQAEG
ncbi:MAG: hypothetical protein H6R18_2798 [Proteobacteria bacterium]|nr:hypothetical protein [Pseudomonadota bacterium]